MKSLPCLLLIPAATLLLGGCVERVAVRGPHAAVVVAGGLPPPPALLVEAPGPRPYAAAVYHRGHWRWNGHRYVWVHGYYGRV